MTLTRGPQPLLGASDFRAMREPGVAYVDKTDFVRDVLASPAAVLLFPRPRRFGKTLNLSTLRCFVEKSGEDASPLFEGLSVWSSAPARAHFQRYPVIFMTFKDVKAMTFEEAFSSVKQVIRDAYHAHREILDAGQLTAEEAERFRQILRGSGATTLYWTALRELSGHLHRHHGEHVVILIDEYDTPIHAGFSNGYYDEIVELLRNFLSGVLKDNPSLFRGVLTGILRVAKESIFSGLNNLTVDSVLRPEFSTSFGFTEAEVERLARVVGHEASLPDLRGFYNGYVFGGHRIYNPWSVLSFLASEDKLLRAHWVATSSNDVIRDLLIGLAPDVGRDIEDLLGGGSIEKRIDENVSLREASLDHDAIWSFLLFSGYLTALATRLDEAMLYATLAIPNTEVALTYKTIFRHWFEQGIGGARQAEELMRAILAGDAETCERLLGDLLVRSFSHHDAGSKAPAEQVYHAFVLGLLVTLEPRYTVRSNRESGYGRYDVMILPKTAGQPGAVLELKVLNRKRKETSAKALTAAMKQLRDKDYAAELRAAGAAPIHEIAAVFDRKKVWVKARKARIRAR